MSSSTLRVDTLLIPCRLSCANDSYVTRSLSVNDYEQSSLAGHAVRSAPIFVRRMFGIRECDSHRIAEYRNRFVEGDAMLALSVRGRRG